MQPMSYRKHLPALLLLLLCLMGLLAFSVFAEKSVSTMPPLNNLTKTPDQIPVLTTNSTNNVIQYDLSVSDIVLTNCSTCHGQHGQGVSSVYPAIAGQHRAYLEKQLLDFKNDKRKSDVMRPIIANLHAASLKELADYFSALPPRKAFAKETGSLELGRRLWRAGNTKVYIPSCMGCHGPNGLGIPTVFPRLAGQHKNVIIDQLQAFRKQSRTNDPNAMMQRISERMTDKEIEALAAFIEGLR